MVTGVNQGGGAPHNDSYSIRINQPLDGSVSSYTEQELINSIASGVGNIELDMQEMHYMTSSGAMMLVNACMNLQPGQTLSFNHPNERVRNLLNTIGLDHYIADLEGSK